jgi:hypothetical protein
MEELQIRSINVTLHDKVIPCELKERDFGDYIVYDVFAEGNYLVTLSKDGDVLFNEHDIQQQKSIIDPRDLNEVINQVRTRLHADSNDE